MRLIISPDYEQCSQWAADYVAYKIKAARPTENKPFVMAIPAGSFSAGFVAEFQNANLRKIERDARR